MPRYKITFIRTTEYTATVTAEDEYAACEIADDQLPKAEAHGGMERKVTARWTPPKNWRKTYDAIGYGQLT
jgi:hypothetical protein